MIHQTSYRESSRGSSLAGQKTKDSPMTDFSIILQQHPAVTQRGMVINYLCKRLYARNKTNSSYKPNVSSTTSVSSFVSSTKVSNACSKCKQTVHAQATARLFCNVKRFWAYPAARLDEDQL